MLELRPELGSEEAFVRRVDEEQRPEGYRLAACLDGSAVATAVAGFRIGHSLSRGRNLFVDDLVTRSVWRSHGDGKALLD